MLRTPGSEEKVKNSVEDFLLRLPLGTGYDDAAVESLVAERLYASEVQKEALQERLREWALVATDLFRMLHGQGTAGQKQNVGRATGPDASLGTIKRTIADLIAYNQDIKASSTGSSQTQRWGMHGTNTYSPGASPSAARNHLLASWAASSGPPPMQGSASATASRQESSMQQASPRQLPIQSVLNAGRSPSQTAAHAMVARSSAQSPGIASGRVGGQAYQPSMQDDVHASKEADAVHMQQLAQHAAQLQDRLQQQERACEDALAEAQVSRSAAEEQAAAAAGSAGEASRLRRALLDAECDLQRMGAAQDSMRGQLQASEDELVSLRSAVRRLRAEADVERGKAHAVVAAVSGQAEESTALREQLNAVLHDLECARLQQQARDVEVSELAARLQARSAEVASAQQTAREAARTASEAEAQRAAAQTLLDAQRFLQDKGHADGILHSTHPAADSRRSAEYVVQHTPASVAMQMAVAGRTAADTADGRDQDVQMHEGHSPDASVSGSTMQASTTTASLSLRALQEQLAEVMVVNASLEAANASLQQQLQAAEIQLQQQAEQQRQLARCADLELSAMKAKVHELQAALSAAQAEFEASGQAAAAAAAALQQARSASAASDGVNQVKALEKQLCHYREQVAALQSELARSMQQLSEAQTLVAAAEASVQAHATQLSVLETELEQARTAGTKRSAAYQEQMHTLQAQLEDLRAALMQKEQQGNSRPAHEHAIQQQQQQQRLSNRRAAIGASTEAANAYDVDESDTQAAREPMSLASSPPRKHARMQARLSATSGMGMPADGLSTHCEADALGHMDSPPLLTAGIVSLELEAKGSEDEESQGHELKPAVHRAATLALWEEQVATLQSAQAEDKTVIASLVAKLAKTQHALEQQRQQAAAQLTDVDSALIDAHEQLAVAQADIGPLAAQLAASQRALEALAMQHADARAQTAIALHNAEEEHAKASALQGQLRGLQLEQTTLQAQLELAKGELARAKSEQQERAQADMDAQKQLQMNAQDSDAMQLKAIQAAVARAEDAEAALLSAHTLHAGAVAELQRRCEEAESGRLAAEAHSAQAAAAVAVLQAQSEGLQQQLDVARAAQAELQAQASALQQQGQSLGHALSERDAEVADLQVRLQHAQSGAARMGHAQVHHEAPTPNTEGEQHAMHAAQMQGHAAEMQQDYTQQQQQWKKERLGRLARMPLCLSSSSSSSSGDDSPRSTSSSGSRQGGLLHADAAQEPTEHLEHGMDEPAVSKHSAEADAGQHVRSVEKVAGPAEDLGATMLNTVANSLPSTPAGSISAHSVHSSFVKVERSSDMLAEEVRQLLNQTQGVSSSSSLEMSSLRRKLLDVEELLRPSQPHLTHTVGQDDVGQDLAYQRGAPSDELRASVEGLLARRASNISPFAKHVLQLSGSFGGSGFASPSRQSITGLAPGHSNAAKSAEIAFGRSSAEGQLESRLPSAVQGHNAGAFSKRHSHTGIPQQNAGSGNGGVGGLGLHRLRVGAGAREAAGWSSTTMRARSRTADEAQTAPGMMPMRSIKETLPASTSLRRLDVVPEVSPPIHGRPTRLSGCPSSLTTALLGTISTTGPGSFMTHSSTSGAIQPPTMPAPHPRRVSAPLHMLASAALGDISVPAGGLNGASGSAGVIGSTSLPSICPCSPGGLVTEGYRNDGRVMSPGQVGGVGLASLTSLQQHSDTLSAGFEHTSHTAAAAAANDSPVSVPGADARRVGSRYNTNRSRSTGYGGGQPAGSVGGGSASAGGGAGLSPPLFARDSANDRAMARTASRVKGLQAQLDAMVARVSSAGGRAHTQPLSEGSGATAGSPRAAEKPAVTSTEQVHSSASRNIARASSFPGGPLRQTPMDDHRTLLASPSPSQHFDYSNKKNSSSQAAAAALVHELDQVLTHGSASPAGWQLLSSSHHLGASGQSATASKAGGDDDGLLDVHQSAAVRQRSAVTVSSWLADVEEGGGGGSA